ncbi:signal-regulatory protein beta-1-like isoform X2 [Acipenser ruthenus]|uniref:signal-regulatory protein beta-1-like isoform X2 n=1 Tax=Acipenser ruthenus TaxID=7906 RepID=UPI0027403F04|nr:signal-regulatory protein beta-1-like isoform X2 [Acipenser ruthenus]
MERGLLVSLVILVCSSRGVSLTIITQDPGSVTGTEEGEVTVPCSVTGGPAGQVRWYRDTGSGRQYLYSAAPPPNERNDPRVSVVHQNHATDLSIRIVNLILSDSGMYYCEKYGGIDVTLIARGSGSRLSVQAIPALIITQDPDSVTGTEEGEVTVPCTVTGGPAGPVRWYRDTGSGRQYLYSTSPPLPNERNDPRVSQVHQYHPTDLSIRIVRLTLRDSGRYHCDKYKVFDGSLIASGSGSRLSVRALPPLIITQDPDSVTGTEEGEVTVRCTLSTVGPPGPVRWYRDTGSGRQYLYSPSPPPPNERNDPRVSQVHQHHATDFSIRIVNLTLSDSGMYYCEKYGGFVETLIARGSGTRLSVRGEAPCSSNLFLVSVFLLVKLALLAAINAFLFVLLKLEQRRLKRVDAE